MTTTVFHSAEYLHFSHDIGFKMDTLLFEHGGRPDPLTKSWKVLMGQNAYVLYCKVYWYCHNNGISMTIAPLSVPVIQDLFAKFDVSTIRKNINAFREKYSPYIIHTPYEWQLEANYLLDMYPYYNLWMEPGLGKSKCLLDDFRLKRETTDPKLKLLIICPNYLVFTWRDQIREHQPSFKFSLLYDGTRAKLRKLLDYGDADIFVTNVEGVAPRKGTLGNKVIDEFYQELKQMVKYSGDFMCCIDEASKIKRHDSTITKTMLKLSSMFKYRRGLTGTPVTKDLRDVWSQLSFLDPMASGYNTYNAFVTNHFRFDPYVKWKVDYTINEGFIQEKVQQWCFVKKADSCLDLPEKIKKAIRIQMTPQQSKMYESIKKQCYLEFKDELDKTKTIKKDHILAKMQIFQQIAKGFIYYEDLKPGKTLTTMKKTQDIPCSKYEIMRDLLENELKDKATIIWTAHIEERNKVVARLKVMGVGFVVLYPEAPAHDNKEKQDRFTSGKTKIIVLSLNAHCMGLNLPDIDAEIFMSATANFDAEKRFQADMRGMRANRVKKDGILSYDIMCVDSIEELMFENLTTKTCFVTKFLMALLFLISQLRRRLLKKSVQETTWSKHLAGLRKEIKPDLRLYTNNIF